ncbi:12633_t:CDS:2, partial [Racocetra persica]
IEVSIQKYKQINIVSPLPTLDESTDLYYMKLNIISEEELDSEDNQLNEIDVNMNDSITEQIENTNYLTINNKAK